MANYNNYFRKRSEETILAGCLAIMVAFLLVIASVFIYAAIGMWLWNIIVVPVFCAPVLGYWQMFGLMWLVRMIFGSIHCSNGSSK